MLWNLEADGMVVPFVSVELIFYHNLWLASIWLDGGHWGY
jgi:hypothetical protein